MQLAVGNGTVTATSPAERRRRGRERQRTLTIAGTQAALNAALATLVLPGQPDFAGADTLTITSTDLPRCRTSTPLRSRSTRSTTRRSPSRRSTTRRPSRSSLALTGTGLAVADVDSGAANVTVTLSAITGALFVGGGAGVAVSGSGTPLVTLTGASPTSTRFSPGARSTTSSRPTRRRATDTLTLTINDGGATGAGGPRSASAASTITIGASNDAPVNTLPGGATTLEDTPVVYSAGLGNQISITDVDAGGASVQVRLNVANGVVTLGGVGGLTFTAGDGTADATMTFTGTVASINAALDGLVLHAEPELQRLRVHHD